MNYLAVLSAFLKAHWLLSAFLAPLLWAAINVVDAYLVSSIYRDEWDGAIITGFFQIIPLLVSSFFLPNNFTFFNIFLWLAILAGILFNSGLYFYYKALFKHNDVAFLQIVFCFITVVVPLLSFAFWGDKLSFYQLLGIAIVLPGAILLSANKKLKAKFSWNYFKIILSAVLFISLSMVFMSKAYSSLPEQNFLLGFWGFSLGGVISASILILKSRRKILPTIKKYFKVFLILEGANLLGNLASQRAIAIVPSVAYVAVAETFQPVFIMVYSFLIIFYFVFILKRKTPVIATIYKEQLEGAFTKVAATIIMAIGIFVMTIN